MHRPMITIGLTGGIASGKTNVSKYLAELGARVLDADKIGHQVYEPNTTAFQKVVSTFGNDIVSAEGKIDRRILGSKVFGNSSKMKELTDIVWPEIAKKTEEELEKFRQEKTEVAVVEAAVLIEANWQHMVDKVWVTFVPSEVAIERIMNRNGLTREESESRVKSQMSNEEKATYGDVVIDTNGPYEQTRQRVVDAWNNLLATKTKANNNST